MSKEELADRLEAAPGALRARRPAGPRAAAGAAEEDPEQHRVPDAGAEDHPGRDGATTEPGQPARERDESAATPVADGHAVVSTGSTDGTSGLPAALDRVAQSPLGSGSRRPHVSATATRRPERNTMKKDIHPDYIDDRGDLHLRQHVHHAQHRDERHHPRRRVLATATRSTPASRRSSTPAAASPASRRATPRRPRRPSQAETQSASK